MNAAVRAAIEARITELDAKVIEYTQTLTSYEHQLTDLQTYVDAWAEHLTKAEAERDELLAALPEEVAE